MIRSFLWDLRGRQKEKFLKKGCFHNDKKLWPAFPRNIVFDKPLGTIHKGQQSSLTITVEVLRSFLKEQKVVENKKLWKERQYNRREKSQPSLFGFTEHDKCHKTIYMGPEGLLTVFVQVIGSFLSDPIVR